MSTWVRLDDAFPDHPKILGLSDAAFRLEVTAICYAHRNLTDGWIPEAFPPPRLARSVPALVDARLWVPNGSGWGLNDYLDWQTSKARIEQIREQRSQAGRRGAMSRWQPDDNTHGN
jgi:hypothetical protein